jgi:hypothetical protein
MTNSMLYLRVARHKILAVEIHVGSSFKNGSLNRINMLLYIILFTDEYRHVIALVFLLTLNFCLKNPAATRGVSPSYYYIRNIFGFLSGSS